MEIIPGVHHLKVPIPDNPLGHLNCYLIQGKDGWLMVDTGWNEEKAFRALESQLQEIGIDFKDVSQIVVTHFHADHYGLAGRIKQLSPGTKLIMHKLENEAIIKSRYVNFAQLQAEVGKLLEHHGVPPVDLPRLQTASEPVLKFVAVAYPDQAVSGGETISTGYFQLQVMWTPGHSPGHICLYEPEKKLFFSGDHILPVITPNISYHPQSKENPLADYLNSLGQLQQLPTSYVFPAHEQIFHDLGKRIGEIVHHHELRNKAILEVIKDEPHTAWFISSQIHWDVPDTTWETMRFLDKRIAVTETLAHLEFMRDQGRVERIAQDDLFLYKAI